MCTLFITRSYPPSVGGMENLSYNLIKFFSGEKQVIALGMKNKLHLIWFIPYALIKAFFLLPKIDNVHINDPVLSFVGFMLKKIGRKPVTVNLHGLDITYRNFFYQKYLSLFLPSLDKYICISDEVEKKAKKMGLKNTIVIPVGVDFEKFKMKADKERAKRILSQKLKFNLKNESVLLTTGRLVERKGVYWFIKNVFPNLKKCVYVVIGDGKERERITKAIYDSGLEQKIFLLGQVSNENLLLAYKAADIFVMPNIPITGDLEGFGIVALEAASSGLPVVTSDLEGLKDAIQDGKNGFLVKPKDNHAFIKKMNELLANDSGRKKFGKKASDFTRRNYDWPKIAGKYKDTFRLLG